MSVYIKKSLVKPLITHGAFQSLDPTFDIGHARTE